MKWPKSEEFHEIITHFIPTICVAGAFWQKIWTSEVVRKPIDRVFDRVFVS